MVTNKPSIKSLVRHMVKRVGGLDEAARICGVSEQLVSNWQSDNHPTAIIPIYHARTLDEPAGDLYLHDWARSRGYELVALDPKKKDDEASSIIRATAELLRRNSALESATLDAAEDNHFTATEKREIKDRLAEVKDLHDRLERLLA